MSEKIEFAQTGSQRYGTNWNTYSDYQKFYFKRVDAIREEDLERRSKKKKVFPVAILALIALATLSFFSIQSGNISITGFQILETQGNFNVSGSLTYSVGSHHIGITGKNSSLSTSFDSRFTQTYNQGGSNNASSSSFSANVGWLSNSNASNLPIIESVNIGASFNPIEATYAEINFSFVASDADGDISSQTGIANFTKSGEQARSGSCPNPTSLGSNRFNFSCSVQMWYFDSPGIWNVTVTITDITGNSAQNTSTYFTYNSLTAMVIAPSSISWPSLSSGTTNQTANTPTTVNNTGNVNLTLVKVKAADLFGSVDSAVLFNSSNFTASISTGGSPPAECAGIFLAHNVSKNISGASVPKGNLSIGSGTAQEQVYYCIPQVPTLKRQNYTTTNLPWFIEVTSLLAVFSIKRKRPKSKKKSKEELINELSEVLSQLDEQHDLGTDKAIKLAKELQAEQEQREIQIPVSVFSSETLAPGEALIKYLKDHAGMRFSQIADHLDRDDRTIWTEYKLASSKQKTMTLKKERAEAQIPLSIFKDRRLSILEALVSHLREQGLANIDIARMLGKDPRNTYTSYARAAIKMQR